MIRLTTNFLFFFFFSSKFDDYQWKLLPEDYNCPGLGIDIFKTCFEHLFIPIHVGYQYHLKKLNSAPLGRKGDEELEIVKPTATATSSNQNQQIVVPKWWTQFLTALLPIPSTSALTSASSSLSSSSTSITTSPGSTSGSTSSSSSSSSSFSLPSSIPSLIPSLLPSVSSLQPMPFQNNHKLPSFEEKIIHQEEIPQKKILVLGDLSLINIEWLTNRTTVIDLNVGQLHTTYVASRLSPLQRRNIQAVPKNRTEILIGYAYVLLSDLLVKSLYQPVFDIICIGDIGGDAATSLLSIILAFALLKVGGTMVTLKDKNLQSNVTNIQLCMDGLCDCYEPHIQIQPVSYFFHSLVVCVRTQTYLVLTCIVFFLFFLLLFCVTLFIFNMFQHIAFFF